MLEENDAPPEQSEVAQLVPASWRPPLSAIVSSFVRGDFHFRVPSVEPLPARTAEQIRGALVAYGATLVELPDETWQTSISQWTGSGWDVLVDLWTREEGRSDLVLHVNVQERGGEYQFAVHLVYVP